MSLIPSDYFLAFVLENLDDCKESPWCLRRAFNASVSAAHMADHYFAYNARNNPRQVAAWKSAEAFVKHVVKETNGAFADIRSISNAYKHLYESPKRGGQHHWTVASGGSVASVEFGSAEHRLKFFGYGDGDEPDGKVPVEESIE